MSEPTKGQIEEAYKLAKEFVATHAREVSPLMLFPDEIANLIAHVRKQAREDALEWFLFIALQADTYEEIVRTMREEIEEHSALKTQGDAQ